MFLFLMPVIFIAGIIAIALEDKIRVNKAAVAVGMSVILWIIFLMGGQEYFASLPASTIKIVKDITPHFSSLSLSEKFDAFFEYHLIESLGDVSTTLFFVLASMAIVEIVDSHGGFEVITTFIKERNKRKLLWIFSVIAFFLSAILGNIAAVIVIVALIKKLVPHKADRFIYVSMLVMAANAGGSWSPIGDVTTLLLWTSGNITVEHQVSHIFLSSLTMLLIPLSAVTFMFKRGEFIEPNDFIKDDYLLSKLNPVFKTWILSVGVLSLAIVPFLQIFFNIPPFMGVLLGLSILWYMTDRIYYHKHNSKLQELRVSRVFTRIDVPTVLFFLGILMSVASLKTAGHLQIMANYLDHSVKGPENISVLLGLLSSVLDNVALVAGTIGMYPLQAAGPFAADGSFWTFLAYCAVTGGSILIIGSASGVTAMGMEKTITFGSYLKKFSLIALIGYFAGAAVYMMLF
jgi:Na+/H+ antiporter NhaD/arsenite permease-like protein